jgi:SEC-C motif
VQREALLFTDEGVDRDPVRPQFQAFVGQVERYRDQHGVAPAMAVAELSRLFRNRADRQLIDRLIDEGRADLMSAREHISTTTAEGQERYRRAADLLMLAYEGGPLAASTRSELVDRYVDEVLAAWLDLHGVPPAERSAPLMDVRARLRGLARRWDTEAGMLLLAPYMELAEVHEPAELAVSLRALAVVGVRNSDLESLHLADHIQQYDWRVLTQAAAHALARLPEMPVGDISDTDDPFAGVVERYPTAAAAFAALAELRLGEEADWAPPDVPPPPPPAGEVVAEVSPEGYDVLHAMDPRISNRMATMLAGWVDRPSALGIPSLKHISRNPHKLFAVADYLLAHGSVLMTANVLIEPAHVRRRPEPASYNSIDLSWCGGPRSLPGSAKPGRNDPCPCGSGLKYKRCCGRVAG